MNRSLTTASILKPALLAAALAGLSLSATAAPVTYAIDPAHTNVLVRWNHLGFSNPHAHFGNVEGTLVYDAENPSASSVSVTIPLSGLDGFDTKFNEHLQSAELFDSAAFPQITFRSTSVESSAAGKLRVSGDVTVKGITRPTVLDVTLNGSGPHPMMKKPAIGFDATTTLKRSDFGLGYAAPAVSDEVTVLITTEGLAR